MPKYTINGVTYSSPTPLSDADLEELSGGTVATAPTKTGLLDFLPKGVPSWMQSKPGQGWDDTQAAGGDVTNPMAYLSETQKTEQGAVGKAISKGVQTGVREGTEFAKGAVINPIMAVGQLVSPESVQNVQEQLQTMRTNAGGEGFSPSELLGAFASPINRLLPGRGYTGGAVGAVMQPLEGKDLSTWDILTGKATQAVGGALMGRFAENVIAGLTPKLKEGAAELLSKGIPVSPGQAYEGAPGWLFRQMEGFGLGPKAETVNKAFNPVVANEVLSSIGETVPKTVKPGQQSVAYTQSRISKFYDDSLSNLGKNPFDAEYKQGMNDILKAASQDITDEKVRKVLINSLNANIGGRVEKGGISGPKIKDLQEWLKERIAKYKDSTGINEIGLHTAYSDTLANLNQFISRIDVDGNIAKADSAWAKLYGFADASKKATAQGGVFNPEQLATAVVAQAPTTLTAGGGRVPMNELAQTAVNVLGKQEPLTLVKGLMLGSKALTGSALAYASGPISIPILMAAGASYGVAKQLMKDPSKARVWVQKALEKNPGMFGAAGTDLYNQLTRENAATTP